uniref:ATP synthase membrane subunit f n=1 Tax=Salmo trutta TaxID=8032 RepID=A0A674DI93_SALTR
FMHLLGSLPVSHSPFLIPLTLPLFLSGRTGGTVYRREKRWKGGMGGVAMLLAGYCILSYTCKHDRWRKYH